jgi:hypothetical protein
MVVTILDGATEIGVLAVVVWLASRLQMTVEKKLTVCAAFVWRLGWALPFSQSQDHS